MTRDVHVPCQCGGFTFRGVYTDSRYQHPVRCPACEKVVHFRGYQPDAVLLLDRPPKVLCSECGSALVRGVHSRAFFCNECPRLVRPC